MRYLVAIDPGTEQSGVCIVRTEDYRPMWCAKLDNGKVLGEVLTMLYSFEQPPQTSDIGMVIERMQGNSFTVGSDVFLTCEWIGRFDVMFQTVFKGVTRYVFRRDEYKTLCGNLYSHNDKGVRQSLVDRFAYGEPNYGKGTKAAPGWFHGFAADAWQSYGIACTFLDVEAERLSRGGAK